MWTDEHAFDELPLGTLAMYLAGRERSACLESPSKIRLSDVRTALSDTRTRATVTNGYIGSAFNTDRRRDLLRDAYTRARARALQWRARDERFSWIVPLPFLNLLSQIDVNVSAFPRSSTAAFDVWRQILSDPLACELLAEMRDVAKWMPWMGLEILLVASRMKAGAFSELGAAVVRASASKGVKLDDTDPLAWMPESLRWLPSSFAYQFSPRVSFQRSLTTLERAGAGNLGHLASVLHPEVRRAVQALESRDWIAIRRQLFEDPIVTFEQRAARYVDNRLRGGGLWVVDRGRDEALLIRSLAAKGIDFQYAPQGSRATSRRPGWYRVHQRERDGVGRGQVAGATRGAAEALFAQALRSGDAGRIELDANDEPRDVKRTLHRAARRLGIQVRSSWTDESQSVLEWKAVR